MKRRWFVAALACVILLAGGAALWATWPRPEGRFGLFSWDAAVLEEEEAAALAECIRLAEVGEIYQEFPESWLLSGQAGQFVQRMHRLGVAVYALTGAPEWAYDSEGADLIAALKQVADYNAAQREANRITGVMVDVEPYLLEEWDAGDGEREALMDTYLKGMRAAYVYALRNDLELWVCVPTFYDVTNPEMLENLVALACDGVAVMNYNREDEYGQIKAEVELAERYGKRVLCIYELQRAGSHDLQEINTYAQLGLEALWQSAQELEQDFAYEALGFAYHYYKPLKTMLGL